MCIAARGILLIWQSWFDGIIVSHHDPRDPWREYERGTLRCRSGVFNDDADAPSGVLRELVSQNVPCAQSPQCKWVEVVSGAQCGMPAWLVVGRLSCCTCCARRAITTTDMWFETGVRYVPDHWLPFDHGRRDDPSGIFLCLYSCFMLIDSLTAGIWARSTALHRMSLEWLWRFLGAGQSKQTPCIHCLSAIHIYEARRHGIPVCESKTG